MPTALLKLTALAGVIGVGSLMVVQVQQTIDAGHAGEPQPTTAVEKSAPKEPRPLPKQALATAKPLAYLAERQPLSEGVVPFGSENDQKIETAPIPIEGPEPKPVAGNPEPPPFEILPAEPTKKPSPIIQVGGTRDDEPEPFGIDPKKEPEPAPLFDPEPKEPKKETPPPGKSEPDPLFPEFPAEKPKREIPSDPGLDFPDPSNDAPKPLPKRTEPRPIRDPLPKAAPLPKADPLPREPLPPSPSELKGDGLPSREVPRGQRKPQLTVEKIAPKNAVLGKALIYHIDVKNVGNSSAKRVVVEDRIPKGTRLTGTIPQAKLDRKTLIWNLGTLKAGEKKRISVRVVPTEPGPIGSVATVRFVAEVAAETVVTAPQLKVELTTPKTAEIGSPVDLKFRIKNTGTGDARGVVLFATLPEGLAHSEGKELEYERLDRDGKPLPLKAGDSMQVTLRVKAAKPGAQIIQASVKSRGNQTAAAKSSVTVLGSQLKISRVGPKARYIGRPVIFANTIKNTAFQEMGGITVVETVPEGMAFVDADNGGKYIEKRRLVVWKVDSIKANAAKTLRVRLLAKTAGEQRSAVTVYEPNGLRSETTSSTKIVGLAALGLNMAGGAKPVAVGERLALRFNAKNSGTGEATNVSLSITVPAEIEVISLKGPGKYTRTGNTFRFPPVARVQAASQTDYEIVIAGKKAGNARLKVQMSGDQLAKPLLREESIVVFDE